jgi:hypothetical protein
MPLSADPPLRLKVGILWDADCIASNAAAVVDVLRTLQNLAAMRSPPAVLAWEWLVLDASDIPSAACHRLAAAVPMAPMMCW